MKYLITSSLLDSYDWLKSCPKNFKEKAIDDFFALLKREHRPTTEACQRGIDFERFICENCNSMNDEQFKVFATNRYKAMNVIGYDLELASYVSSKVASLCRNGKQQVAVKRDLKIGDDEYHLFGYADIVFPDKIIDIKTTGSYTEGYHYVKRSQHYLYSYCLGINTFEYLVADFKGTKAPKELHRIEFDMTQEENLWVLEKRICDVVSFIRSNGLFDDYCNEFTAKHDDCKK